MKEKSQASAENLKPQRKNIEVQCNIEWPICFKALKQHKSDLGEIEVWTFKQEGPPNLIHDYLIIKNKKSYKPQPSQRCEEQKLMIGRIPHDCNVNQYNKKHTTKKQAIQLEEYPDNNENHLGLVGLQKNQHIIFYERATSMNLSFLQFGKPKSPQKKVSTYNYRPSANQNSTKKQIKIKPVQSQQHQLHSSIDSQTKQHSRNPFKKIKSKWKQRKLKHLQKS